MRPDLPLSGRSILRSTTRRTGFRKQYCRICWPRPAEQRAEKERCLRWLQQPYCYSTDDTGFNKFKISYSTFFDPCNSVSSVVRFGFLRKTSSGEKSPPKFLSCSSSRLFSAAEAAGSLPIIFLGNVSWSALLR